ncbi:MAG TPA: GntR family transcriptional regulator, partial [Caulobacteraceae bacterium]|nr:GntR family transcriptional regulator [Caulobacteraceae bacterium]
MERAKLGEQVARRIEDRILAEGWPVGHRLGHEADLAAAAGVGRWTFREALRLLEHSGLVVSRRGGGGGLFVAAAMLDVVCNGLSNYLEFVRPDPAELVGAYAALRALALDLAARRLDESARDALQALASKMRGPHWAGAFDAIDQSAALILEAAANPALTMLTKAIAQMVLHAAWYSTLEDQSYHALFPPIVDASRITVEALLAADLARARAANYD